MLVSIVLKGRKAIWHSEESEVFAANSLEQLEDEFEVLEDSRDDFKNIVSANWRYWWQPCLSEKCFVNGKYVTRGAKAINKRTGGVMENYEVLPLICGVYGGKDDICQVTTSYN
ncbi:hypothetical protein MHBO_003774 [Bonamia ostreae]|uniref:Uncharacterized protein n=1 Tax=Bonamia ostreae TaxID=126728 RepID=A0ABV2ARG1_9EUKA